MSPSETIEAIMETPEFQYKVLEAGHFVEVVTEFLKGLGIAEKWSREIAIYSLMNAARDADCLVSERKVFAEI